MPLEEESPETFVQQPTPSPAVYRHPIYVFLLIGSAGFYFSCASDGSSITFSHAEGFLVIPVVFFGAIAWIFLPFLVASHRSAAANWEEEELAARERAAEEARIGRRHPVKEPSAPAQAVFTEKLMEEFIKTYPDVFLGEELWLLTPQRKVRLRGFIPDILFEDADGNLVICELQLGRLDRNHLYRTLEYRDLARADRRFRKHREVRAMVVFNDMQPEYRQLLDIHGLEPKQLPRSEFVRKARLVRPTLTIID